MRLQNPFAALSPTGLDSQILTVLSRSSATLTIPEIHRLLPETGSEPGVRVATARLVDQGVVTELGMGRARGYTLNRRHLLAGAIDLIASALPRLLTSIAEDVNRWPEPPISVMIFGSAARGTMRADSDIDLLIVAPDHAEGAALESLVSALALDTAARTGNDVRPLVYTESEIEPAPIFDSIMREGIHVFGDPSWLRRQLKRREVRA